MSATSEFGALFYLYQLQVINTCLLSLLRYRVEVVEVLVSFDVLRWPILSPCFGNPSLEIVAKPLILGLTPIEIR